MTQILVGENGFREIYTPINAEGGIGDGDASVGLRMIVVVTFVLEYRYVGKHGETMGKTAGNEELAVIILRELDSNVTAEGGGSGTQIDGYIEYRAFDTTHEFGLRVRRTLEMESAHDPSGGTGLVVLHKVNRTDFLIKFTLREALEKVAAGIAKNAGLDDEDTLYFGIYDIHNV